MVHGGSCWHKFLGGDKMTPLHPSAKKEREETLTKQHIWNDLVEITFREATICSPRAPPNVGPLQAPLLASVCASGLSAYASVLKGQRQIPSDHTNKQAITPKRRALRKARSECINPCNTSHIVMVIIYSG